MKRGIMNLCSTRQLVSYALVLLLLFLAVHLVNRGLVLNFRKDVDTFQPVSSNSSVLPKPSTEGVDMRQYAATLRKYASRDNWLMMALIDQGCADMGVNLYLTALKPMGIKHYLFISQDQATCDVVAPYGIHCHVYVQDKASAHASVYHSKDFLRKMNIRTYMIMDALNLGYNVLHTDVDMTFLKNPLKDFSCDQECDVAPLWDCGAFNAGFLFIRNSLASRAMYAVSKHIADTEPKTDDQLALNRAIKKVKRTHGLKVRRLPPKKYVCGKAFWEDGQRSFAGDNPCPDCVVVHDNWMVSMEAKRYRLMEMQYWEYDGPHKYYSCPERRYLTYSNPYFVGDKAGTEALEMDALKAAFAIGALLNRTVVLPRFHCGDKGARWCNLLDHLLVRQLDEKFKGAYRESNFLSHKLIPVATRDSTSRPLLIDSSRASHIVKDTDSLGDVAFFRPLDREKGATPKEILEWFGSVQPKVLRFHSLYGAMSGFSDYRLGKGFPEKIKSAFSKKGNYRQFNR